jgi:tRNA (adenine57-N1/adenine58-N1)-methyltransferase
MTLLRAGAQVTGYEIRQDFAERARQNVEAMLGSEPLDRYKVEIRDAYEGIDETELDGILLDLPEPWQVVPHAARALRRGGTILAYTPSIVQAATFRESLGEHGFAYSETLEVMHRSWHIEGAAVRPAHRMVGHTGFLSHARLLGT